MTKALLERNPAAAPGAQQAVGAAVGSIVEGAAEGDPRLKQVFGLLEKNKIAEATQLLNAVAMDKTAHAEQATKEAEKKTAQAAKDRKEAAVAYRRYCGACRSEASAGGLREGARARSGRSWELVLGRLD